MIDVLALLVAISCVNMAANVASQTSMLAQKAMSS